MRSMPVHGEPSPARASGLTGPAVHLYAGYLAVQSVLGVVLWVGVASSPTLHSWFELLADPRWVTDAFVYPDLLVTVVGSALSAWGIAAAKPWAVPVVAFTAGSVVYPTIYLFGWVSRQGEGTVALAIMVPVSMFTCWIAWQTYRAWRAGPRSAPSPTPDVGGDPTRR